jgi:excisionase family DNA binding protein
MSLSVCIDTHTYKRSKDMSEPEELLTVREVARRLRVDDTTVRRWIKHGTLEAVSLPHVGKRQAYRVRRRTIENLLNQPALPA